MSTKEKDQDQNNVIEGYNPKVYRNLTILFIILTILNIIAIVYAFAKTGYGLWHAEDALSCIAKIDSSFDDINQSVLKIELHADDQKLVTANIDNIAAYHQDIKDNAEKFRGIDLKNIDKSLSEEFEASMSKVSNYYNTISVNLNDMKNGDASPDVLQAPETESMREDATISLHNLFEKQDKATYLFFCRVGQRFLLVLLFLILTMTAGLIAISRSKKHDLEFALKLRTSKMKTANIRQKAVEIAYTNIVTGLKNRYALSEQLDERMKLEDITIVLYNFNNFKSINEEFGRDYADDYMALIAKQLVEQFGSQAEIFSTEIDEFCVVFNKETPKSRTNSIAQEILIMLSKPAHVRNARIQLNVAGCICHCHVNAHASAAGLFVAMDHSLKETKVMCTKQNRSMLIPL